MARVLLLFVFVALGCTSRGGGTAATVPCILPGVTREARCLTLQLPENPDLPDGRRIAVRAAVVPATGSRVMSDAVFVFAGGPGQAARDVAGGVMPLFSSLDARRDVVFIDQRGTGHSSPLACPDDLAGKRPAAERLDEDAARTRLAECRSGFIDAGVDLAQYATWVAVRDVEAIRIALGYGPINAWGASYGTRAALEYARQFPSSVRTLVLDGVAAPNTILPISLALDADAALEALNSRNLDAGVLSAAEAVMRPSSEPVEITDVFFGQRTPAPLSASARVGLVRAPLYSPALGAVLPAALERARRGDWTALAGLEALLSAGRIFSGMHFSVICAEDVPRISDADRQRAANTRTGLVFVDQYERACEGWPKRPVPPSFYEPVRVDVPVLLLSGGADPATPPRHAEAIASTLPRATHVVVPNLAHGVSMNGCAPSLIRRFITAASAQGLDWSCLTSLPAPRPFVPVVPQ